MFAIEGSMCPTRAVLLATLAALMLPLGAQPTVQKQIQVGNPVWHRASTVLADIHQEPEEEKKDEGFFDKVKHTFENIGKTLKDKIWEMGKEMCEGRAPDHPHCKHFRDAEDKEAAKELSEDESSIVATAPAPAPAPAKAPEPAPAPKEIPEALSDMPVPAPAPAPKEAAPEPEPEPEPAPAPVPAPEQAEKKVKDPAPAPAPAEEKAEEKKEAKVEEKKEAKPKENVEKKQEGEEDETIEYTKKSQKLPSQGVRGKKVQHVDGETQTADWGKEYGHASKKEEHSHVHSGAHLTKNPKSFTIAWTYLAVVSGSFYSF